jgi:integrase
VGLVCAFRQNELSKLLIEDLEKLDDGYHYIVDSSKTDQFGTEDRFKVIPYGKGKMCPVKAIDELLEEIGDNTGPLFRGISRSGNFMLSKRPDGSTSNKGMSHTAVNAVIRKRINLAGIIDECDKDKHNTLLMKYSFHSLRSTFITILRACGVPDSKIMKQTHHTNINIIEMYDRPEMHFKDSAAGDLMAVLTE